MTNEEKRGKTRIRKIALDERIPSKQIESQKGLIRSRVPFWETAVKSSDIAERKKQLGKDKKKGT